MLNTLSCVYLSAIPLASFVKHLFKSFALFYGDVCLFIIEL